MIAAAERHPAYRRHEARLGFGTECENLAGNAKGKGASGGTARPKVPMRRRGADRLVVDEGPVMGLERRGWVIAVGVESTGNGKRLRHTQYVRGEASLEHRGRPT